MKRTIGGWALIVLGLACALLGLAVAVALGPDGRRTTGPHEIAVDGSVLVTGPEAIGWANVRLDLLVEVPASKPVFVGLANTVDVADYVDGVQHLEISRFSTPWEPTVREVDGDQPTVRGAPTALDWWLAHSAGLGGASLSVTLPDEPVSLAVVAIGSSNLSGLEVTLAYGIRGGFYKGLGLALLGLGLGLAGFIVRRGDPVLEDGDLEATQADEEVVYVYVDEDGVEHEVSVEEFESGQFDVVDVEIVDEFVDDQPTSDVDVSAESEHPSATEPEAEPTADTAAVDAPAYYWVDDDGVEHELTPEEVAELGDDVEIVDEDDEEERP